MPKCKLQTGAKTFFLLLTDGVEKGNFVDENELWLVVERSQKTAGRYGKC